MNYETIPGYLIAESPIHHGGDEKNGNIATIRRISWLVDGQREEVPVISGNSIRGLLRRMIMSDMLDQVGYTLESTKLYHLLFAGGTLESVDSKDAGAINLARKKEIRETLPPLSLLGTAIGNQMIEGKMKCGIAIPVCRELAGSIPPVVVGVAAAQIGLSLHELQSEDFMTRKDDLHDDRGEDERAHQMIVHFETIVPGTVFYHAFTLQGATEVERAVLGRGIELWRKNPYVGGKGGTGYGKIQICYAMPAPDHDPYQTYLDEHRDAVVASLQDLEERIGK